MKNERDDYCTPHTPIAPRIAISHHLRRSCVHCSICVMHITVNASCRSMQSHTHDNEQRQRSPHPDFSTPSSSIKYRITHRRTRPNSEVPRCITNSEANLSILVQPQCHECMNSVLKLLHCRCHSMRRTHDAAKNRENERQGCRKASATA